MHGVGRGLVSAAMAVLCVAGRAGADVAASAASLSESELGQLFEVFDTNGNGVITRPELRDVIVSFRVDLSDSELDGMIAAFDVSDDGKLQRGEFAELMQGFRSEESSVEAQMERAFLRFDANRDGGLDAREVKALMEASGQNITLREAKTIVFEADEDGNGRIDTREFNGTAG